MDNSGWRGPSGFSIDQDAHTIRLERRFAAPRAAVFDAWTKPEQVTCWWDPAGVPLAACEIDLRVGGSFAFVSRSHPGMPFSGVYREIVAPERLVFDALGALGRVLLQEAVGGTHLVVEIVCPSKEHFEQFLKMGVHEGTSRTLDNLVAYVQEATAPAR